MGAVCIMAPIFLIYIIVNKIKTVIKKEFVMKHVSWKVISLAMLLALFGQWAVADDDADKGEEKTQVEPIELIINFKIAGNFTGQTENGAIYTIGGPGYAPDDIDKNGEISDEIEAKRLVTYLEGAQITFSGDPQAPVVRFSCVSGSCNMNFLEGSVLTSDAGVPLEGRAINMWGPVVRSPDFDPVNGVFPIRILGCGGLKGVGTTGRYAGMVGSICFNGQLNFDTKNPMVLTGSSKCTITLHTPMEGVRIP